MLLRRDVHLGAQPHAHEVAQHHAAELRLGEQEEVVGASAPDGERRDHAGLRGEEQRLTRLLGNVVRDHSLEEVLRVRAPNADVRTRPNGNTVHLASVGSVTLFRSRAEKKVADAGYDPARLPPGQYITDKWPVLHAGSVPDTDLATWDFRIWGQVEREGVLSWEEFAELPKVEVTQDIHCVTRWSRFDVTFGGVPWSALAELVAPKPTANFAIAHAEQGYTANSPLSALEDPLALLATHADGEALTPEHGGPLRLVVPGRYFWKSAKWLRGIELLSTDQPGFWERYGYHNDADPWKEERYGF